MPSSQSPSLRLELQATGEKLNLWGEDLNRVILLIEQAIAGILIKPLTGNATLTATPYVSNEARNSTIIFTAGAGLSAAPTVVVPPEPKSWHVDNRTGYPLTFTMGGSPVTVPVGRQADVFCDGMNLFMFEPIAPAAAAAEGFANQAATSATSAASAAGTATTARNAAQTARDDAITARNAAQTAATNSANSATASASSAAAAQQAAATITPAFIPAFAYALNRYFGT